MTAEELNRLRWQCRRGLLELDLVLERFLEKHCDRLQGERLSSFQTLLAYTDDELWDLIRARTECRDARFSEVVQWMRDCRDRTRPECSTNSKFNKQQEIRHMAQVLDKLSEKSQSQGSGQSEISHMTQLKAKLAEKIQLHRPRTAKLTKEYADVVIDKVDIGQCMGGARDIRCLVTDISYLDPQEGIRFRGKTIPETFAALPKAAASTYPTVESFWYFLLTGDVPTQAQADEVVSQWKTRQEVPQYVFDVIRALPRDSHPMVMLSTGILALQKDSKFAAHYNSGKFNKMNAWESVYEDASDIVARIPVIAAFIYNLKYRDDKQIAVDPKLDMGANFAHMIGQTEQYKDVARMYFILHSDHESGNVSAHTTHLVHSALSDPYYAYSAGLNGLAGPLHGLANQEVLSWTMKFQEKYCKGVEPTKELITKALWDTLNSGQVIPGYGHAVLRKTDPRYMSQREFCLRTPGLKDDPLFKLVSMIFEVAPGVLSEHGHTKNPWPNVDAQSGVIQWYYGLKNWDFYTVLFGVGRALGCMANITWDRALGYALERPKSVTTDMLEKWAAEGGRK